LLQLAQVAVDEELTLRLYVLAGDPRFASMWGILAQEAVGYVVLVDGQRRESMEAARALLRAARARTGAPYVLGVMSGERDDTEHRAVVARQLEVPVDVVLVPVRCGERESVKAGLCALLRRVQQGLSEVGAPL